MRRGLCRRGASMATVALILFSALALPQTALAVDSAPPTGNRPVQDPWVPPDQRIPSTEPPTEGAALRAQVERKLKRAFDAADVNHAGMLTRQQASAAGLGYIAKHFDEIDQQRAGAVRFDDVKRFMRERGAEVN